MRLLIGLAIALFAAAPVRATEVMLLGTYHMANPGHDIHNLKADDVLVDKRQRELAAIADALARFKPTLVAVEAQVEKGAPLTLAKYHDYLVGTLPDSRNEVVQVGYRLAKRMQLADVYGIDVDGDFPYEAVQKFAAAGRPQLARQLDELGADIERMLKGLDRVLTSGTVGAGLRYINDPKRIDHDYAFYANMLRYGAGDEQPGAALVTAWEGRNNDICARLIQLAKAEDRVVVVYGFGHLYLLRRCVQEMPGYQLIEPNAYLPR